MACIMTEALDMEGIHMLPKVSEIGRLLGKIRHL